MKFTEARAQALAKGATDEEIERQAHNYVRQVGSVPFNNMIIALQMHSWNNDRDQRVRLAAALKARSLKRAQI